MLAYLNSFYWPKLGRAVAAGLVASAMAACGGGGGSPGAVPGAPGTGTGSAAAASVTLLTSDPTIAASGADGTEVTLTAIVKDASNNALPGATVSFQADSGTISNTARITDASGTVTEKLSVKGDATLRKINITASSGNVKSAPIEVTVVAPKLLLTSSSGTLSSAGAAGTSVSIRALALNAKNGVVAGTLVNFATDSGSLSASSSTTDASGVASVNLDTGSDPSTRVINVTATVANAPASVVQVNVIGTKIALNAAATVNVGASSDITAVLTDSAGNALPYREVVFSSTLNAVTTKNGAASPATTDSAGKLVLSYKANNAGTDAVTVRALGETASAPITVVASNFTLAVVDANGAALASANTNTCQTVAISNFVAGVAQGGTVSVTSSRGTMYADASCATQLAAPVKLEGGTAKVYLSATGPGVATLTANSSVTGSTVQGAVEFVAPLTSTSVIDLQAAPAIVGANTIGNSSQQAVLRAVVTSAGNPVKNAKVAFTITQDASGGSLSLPSEVLTGSDGSATVSYIAGTTTTAVDGVIIEARVQSTVSSAFKQVKLTVAKRSLFISAGTGNTIISPTSSTYQADYAVFVTDAAGNAVGGVSVTAAVRPKNYYKGVMQLATPSGPWVPVYSVLTSKGCMNEDQIRDGVLGLLPDGTSEDNNGNGRLDPVIPLTITSTGKTDDTGIATISMTYPKDRANWLDVDFTIRGAVAGSEASYVGYTVLPGLAADYVSPTTTPPGVVSPYGKSATCKDEN
jgi:hypothetical protein